MPSAIDTIDDLPQIIPVFPLMGVLLLPRGQLPLNIFEPRYLKMLDDALGRGRYIGMIQPTDDAGPSAQTTRERSTGGNEAVDALTAVGCLGRISSFSETEDGRMIISLTGVCRFRVNEEIATTTPYRQLRVDYRPYGDDLIADAGAIDVDRTALVDVLTRYLDRNDLSVDWDSVHASSNETLVNSLSMISPYGPREKQALLEATSLAERNDILVALTEMALARGQSNDNNANAMQ